MSNRVIILYMGKIETGASNEHYLLNKEVKIFFIFIVILIEVITASLYAYYHKDQITLGRFFHLVVLCISSNTFWSCLKDGQLSKIKQIVFFVIIPLAEFIVTNLLHISNLWGMGIFVLYIIVVACIFKYNLDETTGSQINSLLDRFLLYSIRNMGRGGRR